MLLNLQIPTVAQTEGIYHINDYSHVMPCNTLSLYMRGDRLLPTGTCIMSQIRRKMLEDHSE